MSEHKEQRNAIFRLLLCIVYASLYAYGGMVWKPLRRFIAPAVAGVGLLWFSTWEFLVLTQVPFLIGTSCLGYGAQTIGAKLAKRALVGFLFGISPVWLAIQKRWLLFIFNVILCMSAFMTFGVFNPFNSARIEETVLGFIVIFLPVMSAKNRTK